MSRSVLPPFLLLTIYVTFFSQTLFYSYLSYYLFTFQSPAVVVHVFVLELIMFRQLYTSEIVPMFCVTV